MEKFFRFPRCISLLTSLLLDESKDDPEAFIFTLKNLHEVEPTLSKKRKGSNYSIECTSNYGPDFCNTGHNDLLIYNKDGILTCFIANNGTNGFECHPQYKVALYASDRLDSNITSTYVTVLDYEVYHCY